MTRPDVTARLRSANPYPEATALVDDRRAARDLERIRSDSLPGTASSVRPKARLRYGRVGALVAVAAATATVLAVQPFSSGGSSAYAATPPPLTFSAPSAHEAASTALRAIATRVRGLPQASSAAMTIDLRGWYLTSRVSRQSVASQLEPQRSSYRLDAAGTVLTDVNTGVTMSPTWNRGELATDPAKLTEQLQVGHPASGGSAELVTAVADLYREMDPPPAVRAAILQVLAATPDVISNGSVVDRDGRQGLAFSVVSSMTGLPQRDTLIFDAASGRLLDKEEMLTETAGKLNVPVPSVIAYTVYQVTPAS